ncbi:MAG: NADH-quinone oxidoreductase subunit A [Chloroflexi bacterium]|nr:NADH-quinone oxidoreductase subunit A [Chloroflexota bacterium]
MLNTYAVIGLYALVALAFPFVTLLFARLVRPSKPNPLKNSTYECGMETIGDTWVQFRAQYYLFALVFVIFDVEVIFLYPWAVAYNKLSLFALVEMALFIGLLAVALIYAWRKGILEWQ